MNKFFALCLVLITIISCTESKKEIIAKQPNIIYIMADDHTTQAFGIYGSRLSGLNPTPTLDKIAKEGIIFDNCFVNNSICTPSRAAILTGQHSQANGVLDLEGSLPKDHQYLPIEMKKLGYQTAMIGKWHLKEEPNFDYYSVFTKHGQQGSYFDPYMTETGMKFRNEQDPEYEGKMYEGHSSDIVADITLNWLKNKRDKNKPFVLFHQYKAPHDDFQYAPRYKDYLADTFIPEPESFYDNKNNGSEATRGTNDSLINVIGSSLSKRNTIRHMGMRLWSDKFTKTNNPDFDYKQAENLEGKEYMSATYQEYLKRYLRCVKGVDDNVARIIKYLKEEGLYDNTIIVYTGDQGFMLGEHDYIDKRWMYEESLRMPFFVRYPKKIKAGTRTDAIINNTDFAPTLIEMAGGTPPEEMQGHSFKRVLETGEEPEGWQQSTYYRYWMHMAHAHANPAHFGIRTKKYKLIFFYGKYWVDTDNPDEIITNLKEQLIAKRKELNEEDGEKFPHIQKVINEHWND